MKSCFKCFESLPLSEFYKHPQMGDGHLNKCKSCTKNDVGKHRSENIELVRRYDRVRGNRQDPGYLSEWRANNPKKYSAHLALNNSVKAGNTTPMPCEICGKGRAHGHHDDYDKPLDVRWLCAAHHKQWHVRNGEGANA